MDTVVHAAHERVESRADRAVTLPWYLMTMVAGSTSIVVGLLWDLSWHLSIGRDTFWSPPHVAVYLGAVVAGLSCAALVFKSTFGFFGGSEADRAVSVRLWGFRAPLGAWVAIWGAIALLVSAPFDNWWHNAYGLDIDRFTPPHALLLIGMIGIQIGAMLIGLAVQNRAPAESKLGLILLYAAGVVMVMLIPVHIIEPQRRHGPGFYQLMAAYLPFILVAVARSSRLRWAATITSGFYMLIVAMMVWILPLFPAQPKLGPIVTPVEQMSAPLFPLFLVFPALAIDAVLRRREGKRAKGFLDAVLIGTGFFVIFFVVHWYTAEFLLSPAARNWFFGADRFVSFAFPAPSPDTYKFWGVEENPMTVVSFGIALLWSIVSTRLGLWWGQWMTRVQR